MKKFELFKSSDFDPGGPVASDGENLCTYSWAANIANKRIEAYNAEIESWPVVYGSKTSHIAATGLDWQQWRSEKPAPEDTHVGRIAFIEELPKVECIHINKLYGYKNCEPWAKCEDCGIELVAKWEQK